MFVAARGIRFETLSNCASVIYENGCTSGVNSVDKTDELRAQNSE